MQKFLVLQNTHLAEMIRHVAAQSPLEACGLLAGRGERVESTLPIANADQSPARFRMDALEQLPGQTHLRSGQVEKTRQAP